MNTRKLSAWLTSGVLAASITLGGARIAFADDAQVKQLIGQLGSDDFKVRNEATDKLVKLGKEAIPALKEASKNSDPEVKARAEATIARIQENDVPPPVITPQNPQAAPQPKRAAVGLVPAQGERGAAPVDKVPDPVAPPQPGQEAPRQRVVVRGGGGLGGLAGAIGGLNPRVQIGQLQQMQQQQLQQMQQLNQPVQPNNPDNNNVPPPQPGAAVPQIQNNRAGVGGLMGGGLMGNDMQVLQQVMQQAMGNLNGANQNAGGGNLNLQIMRQLQMQQGQAQIRPNRGVNPAAQQQAATDAEVNGLMQKLQQVDPNFDLK